MNKNQAIIRELRHLSINSGTNLRFIKDGRVWLAFAGGGRVLWGGTLSEMRRVAKGENLN